MYLGCFANCIKESTKWLPGHSVVYFVEILDPEDYLYDKNLWEICWSVQCRICDIALVMYITHTTLTNMVGKGKGLYLLAVLRQ